MNEIALLRTDSNSADFKTLVGLLDKELAIIDGNEHEFYAHFNKIDTIKEVVIAYHNETPVGCGAIKPFSRKAVEVKRMFVHDNFRNQGIGSKIINELENWALDLEFAECILETGKRQPDAIALYKKSGYQIISNYGPYINVSNSVCMAKRLKS
ncbi:putative acetyltransferase [Pedobacter sp. UYP30]|uniref:GNAT family N-acetyltransferase n=1 Tax=Pedobacter sp. UYP30 TaxID=1756400 RepID=UPI0033914774